MTWAAVLESPRGGAGGAVVCVESGAAAFVLETNHTGCLPATVLREPAM